MKILHVTDIKNPNGNGVANAVENYILEESKYAEVGCLNISSVMNYENSFSINEYDRISKLPNGFDNPDIVIFNEVYKSAYIRLYKECLRRNIKYVIIPHGSLVKEAQKNKRFKKLIGNITLFNRFIKKANAIQFLNEQEKNNTNFKYKTHIISGNGVTVGPYCNAQTFNRLIFIGRYSYYVKGLDLLVEVCKDNYDWFKCNNITIELYGRNSEHGYELLSDCIEKNKIGDVLMLNGPIYGKEKEKKLIESYAFIQLSRHEGQPMGIIEALSLGVPCIVTYGTSFGTLVNEENCGFGVNFKKSEVFDAIKKIFMQDRTVLSKNAYKCVKNTFDWKNIIQLLIKEYEKIIDTD